MKFVHIADVHFDIPFTSISDRAELGQERRLEQREAFKKVIEFIKEKNIDYLFISGDLYEHEYIRKSTIDYINGLFAEIPNTKIYITPGNHDPYIKESYYATYNWKSNVKIFKENVEEIINDDVNIYGYGFNDFQMNKSQLSTISIENKSKLNILITHGNIISGNDKSGIYNPINESELLNKGFDYIAAGHIHKRNNYYPGSLISLGFDEQGEHGFIYGKSENGKIDTEFIKIDERKFIEEDFDITEINSEEELIEKINLLDTKNNLYKINLTGYRNFEININIKLIQKNIIKIKNKTKINIEIKENNNTLKGIFIKKLNEKINNSEIDKEKYENILQIGLKILENK